MLESDKVFVTRRALHGEGVSQRYMSLGVVNTSLRVLLALIYPSKALAHIECRYLYLYEFTVLL